MSDNEQLEIPEGYCIINNRVALLLVKKSEVGNNPGVSAACRIEEGSQELLRRYYATVPAREADDQITLHKVKFRVVFEEERSIYACSDDLDEKIEEVRAEIGEKYSNCDVVDVSSCYDTGEVYQGNTDEIPF